MLRERWELESDIYVTRVLGGGRSGAVVLACDVASADFTGHAILKLDLASNVAGYQETEGELHQQAVQDAPAFAARHLPRLIHSYYGDTHLAVLSTIASGGLQYAEPWIDCAFDAQLTVVRQLSIDLLEAWNDDYRLSNGLHDGPDLLKSWLGYRIDPAEGGRLHAFLADEVGIAPDAPSFLFEGHEYPNPLAFATRAAGVDEPSKMRAIRGHTHGDLHGLNVLIGRPLESGEDYHLIDLALYQSSQYLFYDHAYFEIATLLNTRQNVSAETWYRILARLRRDRDHDDDDKGLRSDDFGLLELIKGMRSGITQWVGAHEANRRPSMESQALLARVAAGLNFAHKELPQRASRQMAFVYAASQLKDYVRLNRLDWPKARTQSELEIDAPAASPPPTPAEPAGETISPIVASSPAAPPAQKVAAAPPPDAGDADGAGAPTEPVSFNILSLVGELRRRNVVKVAGVYIVMGWLCLQVVTLLVGALKLPDWTDTLVAVLLAVGFVFCVIATWAFELSPTGLQRTASPERGKRRGPRSDFAIDIVAAAGIIVIASLGVHEVLFEDDDQPAVVADDGQISLAVLPFNTLGSSADSSFADGLTIELADTLEETGYFRMPGVTSTFVYKNNPDNVRSIGQALHVDYVLEGNVRRADDALRIAARLIKTSDGFTIWSGNFEEQMTDLFEAQQGIAVAIGKALKLPLAIQASDQNDGDAAADPFAYRLFVEAMPLLLRRGQDLRVARDMLQKSVEIDPDFAAAWAALSLVLDLIPSYLSEIDGRAVVQPIYYRQAQEAALRAQRLAPGSTLVLHAMANVNRRHRQWLEAEKTYKRALAAEPDDAPTLYDYAVFLVIVGKIDEAIALAERAIAEDPLNRLYRVAKAALENLRFKSQEPIDTLAALFREGTTFRAFIMHTLIGAGYESGDFSLVRELLANCDDCDEGLVAEAAQLIDAPQSIARADVVDRFNDDELMGYQLVDHVWGPDPVLEIFSKLATLEYPKSQFQVVPWSVVGDVGSDPRFLQTLDDMGVVNYWADAGPSLFCPPTGEDGAGYTCGALAERSGAKGAGDIR
ncbi:MAG: hypothetical protein AcusKO_49270 [Acuticoccus sp.]